MPNKPLSASVKMADGAADSTFADRLYARESYSAWSRSLHRRMPLPNGTRLLFESTIDEPVQLLSELVARAFENGATDRYASVFGRGNPHLIDALAVRYGVERGMVLTTTGAANGIGQILTALAGPGDQVLVETPGFDVLTSLAEASGAEVASLVRPAPTFDLTVETLLGALTPTTRMVVISNLHNPSGLRLDESRVLELARAAAEHDVWLVVDEVYADFARPEAICTPLAPNLIRVNSLSKVFGLYGLRCGWVVAAPDVVDRIAVANASREFGASKLTHAIAALILEQPAPFEAHARAVLAERRPILARHLAAMNADGLMEGEMPEFGCMAFPRVTHHQDTVLLAERLWRDHGLVTAPGEMFGHAGHMRLGIGLSPEAMDDGLSRLHEALRG